MSVPLEKIIAMLPWLAAHPDVEVSEFAQAFGLNNRQARDMVQMLTLTGPGQDGGQLVDIDYEDDVIFVREAHNFNRPVRFNRVQVASILTGLQYLRSVSDPVSYPVIDGLIGKLAPLAGFTGLPLEILSSGVDEEILRLVHEAINNSTNLEIEYSAGTGDVSKRIVEPSHLETREDVTYLVAWCQLKADSRTFRLDRILNVDISQAPSTNTQGIVPTIDSPDAILVTLLSTIEMAEEFDPSLVVSKQAQSEATVKLVLKVGSIDWISGFILASGGAVKALEPAELCANIAFRSQIWLDRANAN
jgi:proteasome accessory factor C